MFSSSSSTKRSTLAFFAMLFFICIASFASAARISPAMNENTNNIPSADSNGLIPRTRVPAPTTTGPASARLGASGNWFVHSSVRSFLVLYSFSSFCFSLFFFFFFFFFFFRDDDVLMRAVEKQQHPKPHTDPDEDRDRTPNNHNHNNNNQTRN
jgi:predicted PurR-regulated permease PerM